MSRAKPFYAANGMKIGSALLALGIGAALYMRGPDVDSVPASSFAAVTLETGRTLYVQIREVTVAQWQACHSAGACSLAMPAHKVDYPATGVSFPDAMEYIGWLNDTTKGTWRLPTATEWHDIAAEVLPQTPDPIFSDPSLTWASTYLTEASRTGRTLRPSGAFSVTSASIEDLDGNVWEWTSDCYAGASDQGKNLSSERCPAFVMGGEHTAVMSYLIRDPARGGCAVGAPPAHLGLRLVSDDRP